jgi:hypothetical protein
LLIHLKIQNSAKGGRAGGGGEEGGNSSLHDYEYDIIFNKKVKLTENSLNGARQFIARGNELVFVSVTKDFLNLLAT